MDNQQTNQPTKPELSPEPADNASGKNAAMELLNLESLINRYVADINKLKNDLKIQKQMFDDSFENDKTVKENSDKVDEVQKVMAAAKMQILQQPAMVELSEKIKDIREQIKECQQALSDYLQQYQKVTGTNQIENSDGEIMEIVSTCKLVKKSSKYRP